MLAAFCSENCQRKRPLSNVDGRALTTPSLFRPLLSRKNRRRKGERGRARVPIYHRSLPFRAAVQPSRRVRKKRQMQATVSSLLPRRALSLRAPARALLLQGMSARHVRGSARVTRVPRSLAYRLFPFDSETPHARSLVALLRYTCTVCNTHILFYLNLFYFILYYIDSFIYIYTRRCYSHLILYNESHLY